MARTAKNWIRKTYEHKISFLALDLIAPNVEGNYLSAKNKTYTYIHPVAG